MRRTSLPAPHLLTDHAARLGITLHAAIYLQAPEAVLTQRLLGRASQDGRTDAIPDVIRHRLQVCAKTTGALVPYYTERGSLVTVNADQSPDAVTADIKARLADWECPARRKTKDDRLGPVRTG